MATGPFYWRKDTPDMRIILTLLLVLATNIALAATEILTTAVGTLRLDTVAANLEHPWGLTFLPGGRLLVTERPGRLRFVTSTGAVSDPIAGVPEVYGLGQGGLLDVALDPNFKTNRYIYLSYAEPGADGTAGTAVMRARLFKHRLTRRRVIFRQEPKVVGINHFGSRLLFSRDKTLFITLAERFMPEQAQNLGSDLGKIVRINTDGTIPRNNPFIGQPGIRPEIWSFGHRNVQGAARHPITNKFFVSEFGPKGGDEINWIQPTRNYGWPLVSWGVHYTDDPIPSPLTRPDFTDAIHHWTPSVSPSGMTFYTGRLLPQWQNNLLIGTLSSQALIRLTIQGNQVIGEEQISLQRRIRHVRQGPDGAVYLLTDEPFGAILRLIPVTQ